MLDFAIDKGEILNNFPTAYNFFTTGTIDTTKTIWSSPVGVKVGAAAGAPLPVVDPNIATIYHCVFNPTTEGLHQFIVMDSTSTVLHQATFKVVNALSWQKELGMQPVGTGVITAFPTLNVASSGRSGETAVTAGTTQRTIISTGKHVCDRDGFVYGISCFIESGLRSPTNFTSVKFVTIDPSTTIARGVSEDYHSYTPTGTAYTSTGYHTIMFNKPVPCKAGDWFGFMMDDTATGVPYNSCSVQRAPSNTNSITAGQALKYMDGFPSFSAANSFISYSAATDMFDMKMFYNPCSIAICGHSFYAGSGDGGGTVWQNNTTGITRSKDLGVMLEAILKVPVQNLAFGGSAITQWLKSSASTYWASYVQAHRPSILIYDTLYNDASLVPAPTPQTYTVFLDQLKAACDQLGTRLMLMESVVPRYAAETNHTATLMDELNATIQRWCQRNNVDLIPMKFAVGDYNPNVTPTEPTYLRHEAKFYTTDTTRYSGSNLPDYGAPDNVHFLYTGRQAMAMQIANYIRGRALSNNWMFESSPSFTSPHLQSNDSHAFKVDTTNAGTSLIVAKSS